MPSCKRCCRKCFPNGCCGFCKPPPQVQQQVDTKIELKKDVAKKDTPYGFVYIYPGVRTSENNYTCPMLSVHLYRHSQYKANIAQDKRTIIVDKKNAQQTHQGPQQLKTEDKANSEEEIIMVPVEDVTQIISKSEIKKGLQADIKSEIIPEYADSENCCDKCYASLRGCCGKIRDSCCFCCTKEAKVAPFVRTTTTIHSVEDPNRSANFEEEHLSLPEEKKHCCTSFVDRFRCWCCRKKILVDLIKRTNTTAERKAERVITMKIEYSKYSNLDSASNARLLSGEHQFAYYKDKFHPDTELEFYLVHNKEYDSRNFELKRQEAETLCRTVMQLKGMRNHYPSERELEQILDQSHKRTFGDLYDEPILQLPLDTSATRTRDLQRQQLPQPSQPPQRPAIEQQKATTSGYHEEAEQKVAEQNIITQEDDF